MSEFESLRGSTSRYSGVSSRRNGYLTQCVLNLGFAKWGIWTRYLLTSSRVPSSIDGHIFIEFFLPLRRHSLICEFFFLFVLFAPATPHTLEVFHLVSADNPYFILYLLGPPHSRSFAIVRDNVRPFVPHIERPPSLSLVPWNAPFTLPTFGILYLSIGLWISSRVFFHRWR